MIYIGQDYYIGGDPLNITLYQKKTVKKKGETEGREYFDELGYYHTTAELLCALTRRKIRIDISSLESLQKVVESEQKTYQMIREFYEKYGAKIDAEAKGAK